MARAQQEAALGHAGSLQSRLDPLVELARKSLAAEVALYVSEPFPLQGVANFRRVSAIAVARQFECTGDWVSGDGQCAAFPKSPRRLGKTARGRDVAAEVSALQNTRSDDTLNM
jgi:hypothetical protein